MLSEGGRKRVREHTGEAKEGNENEQWKHNIFEPTKKKHC